MVTIFTSHFGSSFCKQVQTNRLQNLIKRDFNIMPLVNATTNACTWAIYSYWTYCKPLHLKLNIIKLVLDTIHALGSSIDFY